MEDDCILKVEEITKYFPGTKALSSVGLDVKKGEVHALVGENGAGKSTLMNIISGVLSSDEGRYTSWGGRSNFQTPKKRRTRE